MRSRFRIYIIVVGDKSSFLPLRSDAEEEGMAWNVFRVIRWGLIHVSFPKWVKSEIGENRWRNYSDVFFWCGVVESEDVVVAFGGAGGTQRSGWPAGGCSTFAMDDNSGTSHLLRVRSKKIVSNVYTFFIDFLQDVRSYLHTYLTGENRVTAAPGKCNVTSVLSEARLQFSTHSMFL